MRKMTLLLAALVFAFMFVGLIIIPALAQGPSSYESTVNVTNISSSSGTITLNYYDNAGVVTATYTDTIDGYETKFYTTLPGLTGSFDGSLIVSGNVPIASDSMVIGKDSLDDPMNYASYVGVSLGSQEVYLPLLMDSNYGFSTYFSIQNTSGSAVDVDITYTDGVTGTVTGLQPGASAKIDNQAETHPITVFAATLEATGDIAVAVVEWGDGSYGIPLYAYNGFDTGSVDPVFVMVNENNYNYWTSLQVQNIGTSATDVTLQYTPNAAGTACTETQTIDPGEMTIFATYAFAFEPPPGFTVTDCIMGELFVGVATVQTNSASQPLVGIINQLNNTGVDKGAALMTLNKTAATSQVVFPEVYQYYGTWDWFSSITIINLTGSTLPIDDVECRAVGTAPGVPVDVSWTNDAAIPDGDSWITIFWDGWGPMPNDFTGGVICTSATGSIVGTMNTLGINSPGDIDSLAVYEGINVTP